MKAVAKAGGFVLMATGFGNMIAFGLSEGITPPWWFWPGMALAFGTLVRLALAEGFGRGDRP